MIYRGYVRCNPMTSCIASTLCTATLILNTYIRTHMHTHYDGDDDDGN